jgi:hypothetical protein
MESLFEIETAASWVDAKRKAVMIEAVAYGPTNWLTERVAERLCVEWKPEEGGADV